MDIDDAPRPASTAALRRFRTPIRGHAFATPPPQAGSVDVGATAALVREPANPADPLAIAVWITLDAWGPWRLGYLDRVVAARIAPRLDDGLELHARLEGWTPEPDGRWQRPMIALWPAVTSERSGTSHESPVDRDATAGDPAAGDAGSRDAAVRDARVERRLPGVRRRRVA